MLDAIKGFFAQLKDLFWPDRYFAWQTLLMLSLFSLFIASLLAFLNGEEDAAVDVLTTLSWIFFTCAVWWGTNANKGKFKVYGFYIGPWITGAVLCLFLFWPWEENRVRWSLSSWPMISMTIMALPDFVNWELKVSLPKKDRQKSLVMTLLINLLLNSWILFYFRIQDWIANYPSLLANDLSQSAFVYDFVVDRQPDVQGLRLLESTADAITEELEGQPWYQTERWLYTRKNRLEDIAQRMTNTLASPEEQIFWQMAVPQPRRLGEGYLLVLRADWTGPVAANEILYAEQTCKITPIRRARPNAASDEAADGAVGEAADGISSEQIPQTSTLTAVDCGEDPPLLQREQIQT